MQLREESVIVNEAKIQKVVIVIGTSAWLAVSACVLALLTGYKVTFGQCYYDIAHLHPTPTAEGPI